MFPSLPQTTVTALLEAAAGDMNLAIESALAEADRTAAAPQQAEVVLPAHTVAGAPLLLRLPQQDGICTVHVPASAVHGRKMSFPVPAPGNGGGACVILVDVAPGDGGLGVGLNLRPQIMGNIVECVVSGSPAHTQGVQMWDRIVDVGGSSTEELPSEAVGNLILSTPRPYRVTFVRPIPGTMAGRAPPPPPPPPPPQLTRATPPRPAPKQTGRGTHVTLPDGFLRLGPRPPQTAAAPSLTGSTGVVMDDETLLMYLQDPVLRYQLLDAHPELSVELGELIAYFVAQDPPVETSAAAGAGGYPASAVGAHPSTGRPRASQTRTAAPPKKSAWAGRSMTDMVASLRRSLGGKSSKKDAYGKIGGGKTNDLRSPLVDDDGATQDDKNSAIL